MALTEEQKKLRRKVQGAYKRGPEYALEFCRANNLVCRPVTDDFGPTGSLALKIEGVGVLLANGKWAKEEAKFEG